VASGLGATVATWFLLQTILLVAPVRPSVVQEEEAQQELGGERADLPRGERDAATGALDRTSPRNSSRRSISVAMTSEAIAKVPSAIRSNGSFMGTSGP